jgi:hypothetical protein
MSPHDVKTTLIGSTRFPAVAGHSRYVYVDDASKWAAAGAARDIDSAASIRTVAVRRMHRRYAADSDSFVSDVRRATDEKPLGDELRRLVPVGDSDGLGAAVHAELPEHVLDVRGDRLRADREASRDLVLRKALGEQT